MQITKMKWLVSVGFSTIIASVTGTRISPTLDKHKAGGPDLSAGERGSGGLKPTRGAGLSLSAWRAGPSAVPARRTRGDDFLLLGGRRPVKRVFTG